MTQTPLSVQEQFYLETVMGFLAPVREFLNDPAVSEILINGSDEVYVERNGKLSRAGARFENASILDAAVHNIAQFVGRILDAEHPILDARLPDGSRVHVVIPPVSRRGTLIAIRRFQRRPMTMEELVRIGTLSEKAVAALDLAIRTRRNIVVAGGTGTGKTSLLNSLAALISADERILVIEDSAELQLSQPHSLTLETQTGGRDGRGKVEIADLFRSALRLRPDRIVIGEVRGGEALDMIQAMISGHSGSLSTTHAETPVDCLRRLETLAMYRGLDIPQSAIRAQVASAIHLIVIIQRLRDGSRRVVNISEVGELTPQGDYQATPLFVWESQDAAPDGRLRGVLRPTGKAPRFLEAARAHGIAAEASIFQA